MKVAIDLLPCCGQRSGVGTYVYELAKRLPREGDLQVYGNVFNFLNRNNIGYMLEGINLPVRKNIWMPYSKYLQFEEKRPIPYNLLFRKKMDVTHFFNYIVPRKIKGTVIDTVYDLTHLRFPETMDEENRKRITSNVDYSVRRADAILTDSEFIKKEIMQAFGFPDEKVHVVYPSAAVVNMNLGRRYLQRKWELDEPYILYLGNIEPRKNLVRLISAFEIVKKQIKEPLKLVMAGGGWKSAETMEKAKNSPFTEDIIFTGYVSDFEKTTLYKCAEAFIFPSLYEGFGIPLVEAMQCGVPLICSDEASLPEVGGDCARYVKAFDEESIADGIMNILDDRQYASELVKKGLERAKLFSWDNSAEKLKSVYKKLM